MTDKDVLVVPNFDNNLKKLLIKMDIFKNNEPYKSTTHRLNLFPKVSTSGNYHNMCSVYLDFLWLSDYENNKIFVNSITDYIAKNPNKMKIENRLIGTTKAQSKKYDIDNHNSGKKKYTAMIFYILIDEPTLLEISALHKINIIKNLFNNSNFANDLSVLSNFWEIVQKTESKLDDYVEYVNKLDLSDYVKQLNNDTYKKFEEIYINNNKDMLTNNKQKIDGEELK